MDLITLDDLEEALGYSPANDIQEAEWSRSISQVSDWINNYCTDSFSRVDDDVVRLMADWDGEINLPGGPVWVVTSVVNPRFVGQNDPFVDWDLLGTLFNCAPNGVYDITYSHGHTEVPDDVKNLVIQGCVSLIEGASAVTNWQVGDVQERSNDSVQLLLGQSAGKTLAKYGGGQPFSIQTGWGFYDNFRQQGYVYDTERDEL